MGGSWGLQGAGAGRAVAASAPRAASSRAVSPALSLSRRVVTEPDECQVSHKLLGNVLRFSCELCGHIRLQTDIQLPVQTGLRGSVRSFLVVQDIFARLFCSLHLMSSR